MLETMMVGKMTKLTTNTKAQLGEVAGDPRAPSRPRCTRYLLSGGGGGGGRSLPSIIVISSQGDCCRVHRIGGADATVLFLWVNFALGEGDLLSVTSSYMKILLLNREIWQFFPNYLSDFKILKNTIQVWPRVRNIVSKIETSN